MKIPFLSRTKPPEEKRYSLASIEAALNARLSGHSNATGLNVSESSALNFPVVMSCIRILAESVAMLPLIEYRRMGRGKERATDHYLYSLLHDAPNPEMTSFTFRETLQGHLCTYGNAYAEIQWSDSGEVKALWPLAPDKMRGITRKDGEIWYQYGLPDQYGKDVLIPSVRMLHIPFMGYNGISGYSPISLAREAIALGMAQQEYGERLFGNGARPGGILTVPAGITMGKDGKKLLRESFETLHKGLENQHRVAILEDGITWQQVGYPPEESQFLESRDFQKGEIAAWYRIPGHMVGVKEESHTYANIESRGIEFVTYTLLPWLRRWESVLTQKLLLPFERESYFIEFLVEGLMRGDSAARAAFYQAMVNLGVYSQDEVREIENKNPIPDGKGAKHWVGLNLQSLEDYEKKPNVKAPEKAPADIARAFDPVFRQAAQEIVEKEARDIEKARRRADFGQWTKDYYATLPETIEKRMAAPVEALAIAMPEVGAMEILGHLRTCARDYANSNRAALEAGNQIDAEKAIGSLANRCRDLPRS